MQNTKIAILSTWNESCGIASHTKVLKHFFESENVQVDVIPIPRRIFRIQDPSKPQVKRAEDYINGVVAKVKGYDRIIIQFEPGIYGVNVIEILSRVRRIISAANDIVLVFHAIPFLSKISLIRFLMSLAQLNIRKSIGVFKGMLSTFLWERFYRFLDIKARKKSIAIVTHAMRDKEDLQILFKNVRVYDVPLVYLYEHERKGLASKATDSALPNMLPNMLEGGKRYIGVFGYIAPYKGFEVAFDVIKCLPKNYELLVSGSVHEGLLVTNGGIDKTVKQLIQDVDRRNSALSKKYWKEKLTVLKRLATNTRGKNEEQDATKVTGLIGELPKFSSRIHFMGNVSDDDMLFGMMLCDATLFMYRNVRQTASGPISLAIELNRCVIASRNETFLELARYYPDNISFVDIGNYHEVAAKVLASRAAIVREEIVAGMRWVYFDKKTTAIYPDRVLDVYKKAFSRFCLNYF
ncbi:MAG: hypothetical protein LIQ31_11470 [Planctomycetes bacterium]|nr:hypothetical protein [Planctomycetota bacterium]